MQTTATAGAPDSVKLEGKVRARDRDTSWHAASLQTNGKTAAMQVRIYRALTEHGPATDEELLLRLGGDQYTFKGRTTGVTRSGLATRRHELERAGWVTNALEAAPASVGARHGGQPVMQVAKRRTLSGCPATVWRAVADDEPAPAKREPAPARPAPAAGATDDERMAAARRLSQWEIGTPEWAEVIIDAYLNPARTMANLDAAMGE